MLQVHDAYAKEKCESFTFRNLRIFSCYVTDSGSSWSETFLTILRDTLYERPLSVKR